MRKLVCFLVALPLAVPAQAPEPNIRTTTNEVLLDVVVRDRHAQVIRDLKPEEIQVFEDGVPQPIKHFEFFDGRSTGPALVERPPETASSEAKGRMPYTPPTVNQLRDISVVSVVFANLDPRGRKLALDTMDGFIKNELTPTTYVGVFTLGMAGLSAIQMYTNDAEKISAAVQQATGSAVLNGLTNTNQLAMPGTTFGMAGSADTAASAPATDLTVGSTSQSAGGAAAIIQQLTELGWVNEMHDVYADSMHFLTPLHTLVQAQSEIPGRKVVLLFSAGLPITTDTTEMLNNVVSTANRANVTIYAVDTRGNLGRGNLNNSRTMLQRAADASRQQQLAHIQGGSMAVTPGQATAMEMGENSIHANTTGNLAQLAEGTGGQLLPPVLDLREPLGRALEDVRMHYEVAYSPVNTTMDGRFRKIEVKVSRPGAKVFARSGYYAVPVLNGHELYPFEIATLKAMNTQPAPRQFDFHAAALQFRSAPAETQMAFVFQAPSRDLTITRDKEWATVHVCVTGLIRDDQGRVVQKISKDIPYQVPVAKADELQQGVVSFTAPFLLPPGHYSLTTAAVDRLSMKASVSRSAIFVDAGSGFSMSDVSVARRVDALDGPANGFDPLQARGAAVTPELSSVVTPETGGGVKFYAVAYPEAPVSAPVQVTIQLWRDGQLVMKSPPSDVPTDPNGAASILADLPMGKMPAGNYEAQVSFAYKGETVEKRIAFRLGAGSS